MSPAPSRSPPPRLRPQGERTPTGPTGRAKSSSARWPPLGPPAPDAAEGLLTARTEVRSATEHLADVTRSASAAADDAGFPDLEAACAAALPEDEVEELERACAAHERDSAV